MSSTVQKTLLVFAAIVAVIILIGMFLPGTTLVKRTVDLKANPKIVFSFANNIRMFKYWCPWISDPNSIHIFDGPPSGTNAKITWTGDPRGRATITASDPGKSIELTLDFFEAGGAVTRLLLDPAHYPQKGLTHLTWEFRMELGWNPFKRIAAYFSIDGMIGPKLSGGLEKFKKLVEKNNNPKAAGING